MGAYTLPVYSAAITAYQRPAACTGRSAAKEKPCSHNQRRSASWRVAGIMMIRGPPTVNTHGAFSKISQVVWAETPASTMLPTSFSVSTERPSPSRSSARSLQPACSSVCSAFASGPGRRSAPITFGYFPEAASTAVSLPWSQPMSATGSPGRTSSAAAARRASSVGSNLCLLCG